MNSNLVGNIPKFSLVSWDPPGKNKIQAEKLYFIATPRLKSIQMDETGAISKGKISIHTSTGNQACSQDIPEGGTVDDSWLINIEWFLRSQLRRF
jgi:hypothetical protein